ncbi:MAG: ABC transporter permease subunit [Lachnospiraceae bacterium]|nr:ABC transporter permease subunit [Lachnospiraceae bacterium]
MRAIYKREIGSYAHSMIGYAVVAFFLLIAGLFFWAVNLDGGSPSVGGTMANCMMIFILGLPVVTMRLLSDEQKQKTDQLLFSTPVSIWDVVLGKYFAAVTIFTIPFIAICTMPMVLKLYGDIDFLSNYAMIFAFWVLGNVFLALGLLISSWTDNQIVALVVSILLYLAIYYLPSIVTLMPETAMSSLIGFMIVVALLGLFVFIYVRNLIVTGLFVIIGEAALLIIYAIKSTVFESLFLNFVINISLSTRFSEFLNMKFDISTLVYYVSCIILFLYMTVQSVQKRRWS